MCPLLFSYDHHNYARYLPVYLLTMLNLSQTHPGCEELIQNNGLSVSRSSVPGSHNAVDLTIEQTINRYAKSRGGIVGFSRNASACYRWCMTRHMRATYTQAIFDMVDMSSEDSAHKDNQPSNVAQSEQMFVKCKML